MNQQEIRQRWLSTDQAATYLGTNAGTLKTWRSRNVGPRYYRTGSGLGPKGTDRFVRYDVADLDAYMMGGMEK